MKNAEQDLIDAGAQVIWVLQDPQNFGVADGQASQDFWGDDMGSEVGLRVGDDVAEPVAESFEDRGINSFVRARGSVMIVRKRDMRIVYGADVDSPNDSPVSALVEEIEAMED